MTKKYLLVQKLSRKSGSFSSGQKYLDRSWTLYEGVSKSFRTGRLERELQMVQLSATKCSCIAILWVSLVSFAAITLCVACQPVVVVVVVVVVAAAYFFIDTFRKILNTPSCPVISFHFISSHLPSLSSLLYFSSIYEGVSKSFRT
jgi:hypothetical protein